MPIMPQKMHFSLAQRFHQILFVILVVVLCFAWQRLSSEKLTTTLMTRPIGVMGTSCTLCVTVPNRDLQRGNELLKLAEQELRRWEQFTSTWIETSEISRINRAKAGERVPVSPITREFFRRSRQAFEETDGAFDVTCGALWLHWKACEKENRLPTQEELSLIRKESSWDALELGPDSVTKRTDALSVVTGGLAKGMAIDAALTVFSSDPITVSAFVEVGGDLASYRSSVPIEVESFDGTPRTILLPNGGICTSGHSARRFEIQGRHFSQILNPASGQPVPRNWNVTVTAPNAATADYWATALEVLGKDGLSRLPKGIQAEFTELPDPHSGSLDSSQKSDYN